MGFSIEGTQAQMYFFLRHVFVLRSASTHAEPPEGGVSLVCACLAVINGPLCPPSRALSVTRTAHGAPRLAAPDSRRILLFGPPRRERIFTGQPVGAADAQAAVGIDGKKARHAMPLHSLHARARTRPPGCFVSLPPPPPPSHSRLIGPFAVVAVVVVVFGSQVRNIALYLSRTKFRPLRWRNTHPYVVVDRYEDITYPQKVRMGAADSLEGRG